MIKPNILVNADALLLLERIPNEYVDLIYLDPPWNTSNRGSFLDVDEDYYDFIYKVMFQSQRVLKPTGNLFLYSNSELHTDFHIVLRDVFGASNHVSDFIIPKKSTSTNFSQSHDTILFYRKSEQLLFNRKVVRIPDEEINKLYPFSDDFGRYRTTSPIHASPIGYNYTWEGIKLQEGHAWKYNSAKLDEFKKQNKLIIKNDIVRIKQYLTEEDKYVSVGTVWSDISPLLNRTKWKTSQPQQITDRILLIGSNERSLVLDPFCGSGTMIMSALTNNRLIIGCDSSNVAIEISCQRLSEEGFNINLIDQERLKDTPVIYSSPSKKTLTEEDELFELIKRGESNIVEFKESCMWNYHTKQKDSSLIENILKTIAAFANSPTGGTLIIGVSDDGKFINLQDDFIAVDKKQNRDGYELFLNNKIKGLLGAAIISKYSIRFYTINDTEVCKILVVPSNKPIFVSKKFYIRNNNQSLELTTQDFYEFYMRVQFDEV